MPEPQDHLAQPMRVVLVLQGGGALGAYQAGVYQALHEHGLSPDWVVGTSIGAINGALIAGNAPDRRVAALRDFWTGIGHADLYDMRQVSDELRQVNIWLSIVNTYCMGVPGFFTPRCATPFAFNLPVPPEDASFYDTGQLTRTLAGLVDFDLLNRPDGTRLTVSAMHVGSGHLVDFDSHRHALGIEHVMASGALPPGLPPVRVDGQLYWDGGLFSNTPLETVLDDPAAEDTLCFMVDLWSAKGPEPTTFEEVRTRQKDVGYASRSKNHVADYLRWHSAARTARALRTRLPARYRDLPELAELTALATDSTMHVVRLVYGGRDWHMAAKDLNFSRGSIAWRWEQGHRDARRSLRQAPWKEPLPEWGGLVVHEPRPEEPDKH